MGCGYSPRAINTWSVLPWKRNMNGHSRLRLLCQSFVQWHRVKGVLHAVTQNIDDVDSGVRRARTRLIVAGETSGVVTEASGCPATASRAGVGDVWRRTRHPTDRVQASRSRNLGGNIDRESRGLVTLSGSHCEWMEWWDGRRWCLRRWTGISIYTMCGRQGQPKGEQDDWTEAETDWLRDRKGRRKKEDLGGKGEGFYSPLRRVFHPAEWPGKRLIRSLQDHRPFDQRNWREGRRCDCWRTPVGHWVSFRDGAAEVFFYFFFTPPSASDTPSLPLTFSSPSSHPPSSPSPPLFLQSQFEFSSRLPILNTFLDPVRPRSVMLKESHGLRRDIELGQNSQPSSTRTPFRRPVTYYPVFCLSDCLGKRIWNHGRGREGGWAKMKKGEGEG